MLLSQIDKGRAQGEHSGEYGSDFSFSFPNRAKKIWKDVSAPYLKDQHDLGDFIAEDDEEESEEEGRVPINPHFRPPEKDGEQLLSPEEQMIATLKKKNRLKRNNDDSDDSSRAAGKKDDEDDSDSSSELEVLPKSPQYEDVEEEDEWTKSKRFEAAKKKAKQNLKSTGESDDDSVFEEDAKKPSAMNGSARKVIDGDGNGSSDSDSDTGEPKMPSFRKQNKKSAHLLNFSDSDTIPVPQVKAPENGGSARKRVMESSDEESS